jgi:hypothetical protein
MKKIIFLLCLSFLANLLQALPSLSIANVTVSEGVGTAIVTIVSTSPASTTPVTFSFSTTNVSAIAGSDYTFTTSPVTLPANTLSITISVPILNDVLPEPQESYNINFFGISANASFSNSNMSVTINDNDVFSTDLLFTTATNPNSFVNGASITISSTVKNIGTSATVATTVKYYYSTDAILNAGDVLLATVNLGALASNASQLVSKTFVFSVPGSVGANRRIIYAVDLVAASNNNNVETNETNNTAVNVVTINLTGSGDRTDENQNGLYKLNENQVASFDVYPNPATDMLTIEVTNQNDPILYVDILNAQGKIVENRKITDTDTVNTTFNLSSYAQGLYFVNVRGTDWHKTKKIMILR